MLLVLFWFLGNLDMVVVFVCGMLYALFRSDIEEGKKEGREEVRK